MESIWKHLTRMDWLILLATIILVIGGIVMIRSATLDAIDPDLINRVPDQIQYAVIGFIAMVAISLIDYRMLAGLDRWLYLFAVILLVLVPIFGTEGDAGARRWLNVGILIQPSEIAKLLIIVTLSALLARRYEELDRFGTLVRTMLHIAVPMALIFIQPNLGTTIVFLVIWVALIWGAGIRWRHILLLGTVALISLPILLSQLQPYQLSRITTFLNPAADPDAQYNIAQAAISIGSGGFTGEGYAAGSQNVGRFLRVRHTDFIFSVIAHEFGMAGALAVLTMFGLLILRILRSARLASDPLGSLICYGVATVIFFQLVVSVGMNLTMVPVTGLTLPLVSSGGTSLLFTLIGIGLVESVYVRRRRI
jgi:rod shape determining protein RodA